MSASLLSLTRSASTFSLSPLLLYYRLRYHHSKSSKLQRFAYLTPFPPLKTPHTLHSLGSSNGTGECFFDTGLLMVRATAACIHLCLREMVLQWGEDGQEDLFALQTRACAFPKKKKKNVRSMVRMSWVLWHGMWPQLGSESHQAASQVMGVRYASREAPAARLTGSFDLHGDENSICLRLLSLVSRLMAVSSLLVTGSTKTAATQTIQILLDRDMGCGGGERQAGGCMRSFNIKA